MDDKIQDDEERMKPGGKEQQAGTLGSPPDEAGGADIPDDTFGDADPPIIISG